MVNSLSCPKVTNPTSQALPDLSNSSPMADINMSNGMNGPSGLVMANGTVASMSLPEECKPEVKIEVLDELFGNGWEDHALAMAASPSSESSLSPSPPTALNPFVNSLLASSSSTPLNQGSLSIKSASTLLAVSTAQSSAALAAAARSLKMPISTFASSLSGFAASGQGGLVAPDNGSLHIVIPSNNPGPDTTTVTSLSTDYKSPTIIESAASSGSTKKTMFTAKGKFKKKKISPFPIAFNSTKFENIVTLVFLDSNFLPGDETIQTNY